MQIYGLSDALLSQQSRKLFAENEGFRVGGLALALSKEEGGKVPGKSFNPNPILT